MNLFDNHTHSSFSPDGKMGVAEAVDMARERGLAGICFTDHYDFMVPGGVLKFECDIEAQQRAIDISREGIDSEFTVLKGIEIGVQSKCIDMVKELMSLHSFDLVIASVHFIEGKDPYKGEYYLPYDMKKAYGNYLEEIYRCMELYDDYDILGHYDYIARYSPYPEGITYNDFKYILDPILERLVRDGKTFEINTKTYQIFKGKQTVFDVEILKRFFQIGGRFISLGSDAHMASRIGENFDYYRELSKSVGLKYAVYYKNRTPHYVEL